VRSHSAVIRHNHVGQECVFQGDGAVLDSLQVCFDSEYQEPPKALYFILVGIPGLVRGTAILSVDEILRRIEEQGEKDYETIQLL
jgi:hypothetical protein